MIIITGMDNSGKTTLAHQLCNKLNIGIVNSPGPLSAEQQKEWVEKQLDYNLPVIYERFAMLEELVYGPILRGYQVFNLKDKYFDLLFEKDPLIIYTRPDQEVIFDFGDRPQMEGVIEERHKLLAAYDNLMFKLFCLGWRILPYNFNINTLEEITNIAKQEVDYH